MERERSGKVIAIVALLVAVAGLSLGFAAFSTTLNITSSADVPIDASVWKVGFSNVNNSIPSSTVTVNGVTDASNNGSIDLTQFVISQTANGNATLHTTNGSKVDYDFYIVNDGNLDAYLNSVTMGSLTCTYDQSATQHYVDGTDQHTTVTAGTGTISNTDCATLFTATLKIGNSEYTSGSAAVTSGFGDTNKLAKPNGTPTSVAAKLTIAYNNDSLSSVTNVPNGDFIVSLGDSTVVYGTSSN